MKFTYNAAKDEWDEPKLSRVILPDGEDENSNCYQLDENELLLVMRYRAIVIDRNFKVLTNIDFREIFTFEPSGEIIVCKPDFYATGARFIIGLGDVTVPAEMLTEHVHIGKSEVKSKSWVSYFTFDRPSKKLICSAKEYGAVLLEQERV